MAIFPDFSAEVQRHRQSFMEAKHRLRIKHLKTPCYSQPDYRAIFFDDPEEAISCLECCKVSGGLVKQPPSKLLGTDFPAGAPCSGASPCFSFSNLVCTFPLHFSCVILLSTKPHGTLSFPYTPELHSCISLQWLLLQVAPMLQRGISRYWLPRTQSSLHRV